MADLDWGSLPAWFTAVGVAVALGTFMANRRDPSRQQAELIYLMLLGFRYGMPETPGDAEFKLVNASPSPAYDVQVHLFAAGRRSWTWWLRRKAAGWWTGDRIRGCGHYSILAPDSEADPEQIMTPTGAGAFVRGSLLPHLAISFRDSLGRRWVRWPDGRLSRRRFWH